jgi:hypothetical protein
MCGQKLKVSIPSKGGDQMLMSRVLAHCADRVSGERSRPLQAPLPAVTKTNPAAIRRHLIWPHFTTSRPWPKKRVDNQLDAAIIYS